MYSFGRVHGDWRSLGRWLLAGWALSACGMASASETISYSRDIRPLLSDSCFTCHGPDEGSRQADLRLDLPNASAQYVLAPGDSQGSELIRRLTSDDPAEQMPPPDANRPRLTAAQIELVRRWIDQGAEYDQHWSYAPISKPAPPAASGREPVSSPIDRFLAARQEALGVNPAPIADRRTLLRRLSYDITGLPPSEEDAAQFLADDSEAAYQALVDRLLASPHYGERMAVFWLDQVRYADTSGVHNDYDRDHWLYRDYVIESFNANKPFDQFTIEQLAGDLLSHADREQRIASGYNRLNLSTEESGSQENEFRAKYAADRVRNASSVWLAATMGCAECHDHKFDAYTMRDFYSFAAFFADIQEPAVTLDPPTLMPTEEEERVLNALEQQIDDLQQRVKTPTPELVERERMWERRLSSEGAPWQAAVVRSASAAYATLSVLEDGSVLASGENANTESYTIDLEVGVPRVAAVRLDLESHPSLPDGGPGRGDKGKFMLTDVRLAVRRASDDDVQPLRLASAWATISSPKHPCDAAIDADPSSGWNGYDRDADDHFALFELRDPVELQAGDVVRVELHFQAQHARNLGRFRLSVVGDLAMATPLPKAIERVIAAGRHGRSLAEQAALMDYFLSVSDEQAPVRRNLADALAELAQRRRDCPKLLIARAGEPRVTRILPRGNWMDDSGEIVTPAIPQFLGDLGIKGRRATRLDLARWLVSPQNPLTARVIVNRLWRLAFGQGLAKNLDDFGMQGAWPTHPELLDWLAAEFVDSGWDVKHLLRLIYTSQAYRRSSIPTPELQEKDPGDELFARQNRFRMEAEFIRDAALADSGLLSRRIGGPSVKPYQPDGYWAYLNYPKREYVPDKGEQQYRRGLYTHWQRTLVHPSLLAFDAPDRDTCVVVRNQSNTPLQALVLLNDPTYVEAARTLAETLAAVRAGESVEANVHWLLKKVLLREARPREVEILKALYERHLRQYQQHREAAAMATSVGQRAAPPDIDAAQLAAWTSVARAAFNSHEFLTRN